MKIESELQNIAELIIIHKLLTSAGSAVQLKLENRFFVGSLRIDFYC